jgi:hypothetical protein
LTGERYQKPVKQKRLIQNLSVDDYTGVDARAIGNFADGQFIGKLQASRVNGWGVIRMLHTFTGVHPGSAQGRRDWWLTRLWSLSMDALVMGL